MTSPKGPFTGRHRDCRLELQIALSLLASKDVQERFCVNGTANEYLLPDDLLNSAFNHATLAGKKDAFTDRERSIIKDFISVVDETADKIPFDEEDTKALIANNAEWTKIRDAAKRCLEELRLDLLPGF
jgi:hypothetical protein